MTVKAVCPAVAVNVVRVYALEPPPPDALMVTTPVPPAGEIVTFVPATIWDTPPVAAAHVAVVPLDVKT